MARNKSTKAAMWLIVVIVAFICTLILVRANTLSKTLKRQEAELASINAQIEEARDMTDEIENEIRYRGTDDYIEDEARESLGLRYPDEIILVPETDN